MNQSTISWIGEHTPNKDLLIIRILEQLSTLSGFHVETLVKVIVGLIFSTCALIDSGHFLSNGILITVPIGFLYVFPEEARSRNNLLIYWSWFGILTLFDRTLECIPMYYCIKLLMIPLLLPKPLYFKKIKGIIQKGKCEEKNSQILTDPDVNCLKSRNSSLTEKSKSTTTCYSTGITKMDRNKLFVTSGSSIPVVLTTSATDTIGNKHYKNSNSTTTELSYYLRPSVIDSKDIDPEINLNDMEFMPTNALVFNGPFDFDHTTYNMKITSKTQYGIAFAIKGNAIPRVTAYPPFGILKPKDSMIIAVTLKKFVYSEDQYNNDRIVFEYALLKDKHANFHMSMLQDNGVTRRKNILIKYNP